MAIGFVSRVRQEVRSRGECRMGDRGTFWGRFSVAPWRWSATLCKFDDDPRWVLHLFCLWVTLWRATTPPQDDMLDQWGFSLDMRERDLRLSWGHKSKFIYLPWMYDFCRTEVMLADGTWVRGRFRACRTERTRSRLASTVRRCRTDTHSIPARYRSGRQPLPPSGGRCAGGADRSDGCGGLTWYGPRSTSSSATRWARAPGAGRAARSAAGTTCGRARLPSNVCGGWRRKGSSAADPDRRADP